MIEDIEISISIYDGEDFAIEFNHFRSIKGCFDKDLSLIHIFVVGFAKGRNGVMERTARAVIG